MLQKLTITNTADNNGALLVKIIHLYKGGQRQHVTNGDFVRCSIIKVDIITFIKKKARSRAIVVRTIKESTRTDGSFVKFDENSLVLIKKRLTPRGKEINGPADKNIKRKKFLSSFSGYL